MQEEFPQFVSNYFFLYLFYIVVFFFIFVYFALTDPQRAPAGPLWLLYFSSIFLYFFAYFSIFFYILLIFSYIFRIFLYVFYSSYIFSIHILYFSYTFLYFYVFSICFKTIFFIFVYIFVIFSYIYILYFFYIFLYFYIFCSQRSPKSSCRTSLAFFRSQPGTFMQASWSPGAATKKQIYRKIYKHIGKYRFLYIFHIFLIGFLTSKNLS